MKLTHIHRRLFRHRAALNEMRFAHLGSISLVLLAILPACAQEDAEYDDQDMEMESLTAEQLRNLHSRFDGNGDGKVSMHEILAYAKTMSKAIAGRDIGAILEEIDVSKDGRLSLEELLTDLANQADGGDEEEMNELEHRKSVETAKFQQADVDHDGLLDESEIAALFYPETHEGVLEVTVAETMRAKDQNGDGKLTPIEFWEAEEGGGDSWVLSEEENKDFAKLDQDGDGFLDANELRSWESGSFHTEEAMQKLFEVADVNNDMHVDANELESARQAIGATDAQYHLIEWAEHHEL